MPRTSHLSRRGHDHGRRRLLFAEEVARRDVPGDERLPLRLLAVLRGARDHHLGVGVAAGERLPLLLGVLIFHRAEPVKKEVNALQPQKRHRSVQHGGYHRLEQAVHHGASRIGEGNRK